MTALDTTPHAPTVDSPAATPHQRGCPVSFALERTAGVLAFAYGLVCYAAFLVTFLYAMGFVGNWLVPKSIDSGTPGPALRSMAINAGLLMIFVVQHTIMARAWFKRRIVRILPAALERSTFVLLASASLMTIFAFWQPLPQTVWSIEQPIVAGALVAISLVGWLFVPLSSFAINHFDLFGLRQTWLCLRGRGYHPVGFRLVGPYRLVRHPLMLGFIVAFWSTPHMSLGHLFFAVMTTGYILFGIWIEERGLLAEHGEAYQAYRRQVRALVPLPRG